MNTIGQLTLEIAPRTILVIPEDIKVWLTMYTMLIQQDTSTTHRKAICTSRSTQLAEIGPIPTDTQESRGNVMKTNALRATRIELHNQPGSHERLAVMLNSE